MDDVISRQAAIDALDCINGTEEVLRSLPSAQPTLYGYKIEHLAYIARVMQKEGVTAEYAVRTFDDMSRALRMIIEEAQETVEKSLNAMPWNDADLIKGTWDTKEMSTTKPDKIEVRLQEPHALMTKEFIVKEITYPMGTKQETVGELIRCKDCKNWEQESICEGYCHETELGGIDEDHFCGCAERR